MAKNVTTNKWPLWSYEHMYTQKKSTRATEKFINYMQTKKVQQTLVEDANYINIHDMKVQRTADGKTSIKE